jgi:peptide chain release factor 1
MSDLLDKLEAIHQRRKEVETLLSDAQTMSNMKTFAKLSKEYRDLEPIEAAYFTYRTLLGNIDTNKQILAKEKDEEFREMAKMELGELEMQVEPMEETIRQLLIPEDPTDYKNALVEVRSGTGGDEASLSPEIYFACTHAFAMPRDGNWK